MIWYALLDPADLSLKLNYNAISSNTEEGRLTLTAIINCVFGNITGFHSDRDQISSKEGKENCAYLASTIWHEHRHFIDLVLLNYGNYLFRQFQMSFMNTSAILSHFYSEKSDLVFPFEVFCDKVRRLEANVDPLPPSILNIAVDLQDRGAAIAADRKHLGNGLKELGGYAQLEALGSIFQTAAIENIIPDFVIPYQKRIKNEGNKLKYEWFLEFVDQLKLPTQEMKNGQMLAKVGFLPMILYGSLVTRSWNGDEPDANRFSDERVFLRPLERLLAIMQYLEEHPSIFEPFDFESVWGKVNEMTKSLFGRTISEEIEVDIHYQEKTIEKAKGLKIDPLAISILEDHLSLRKGLLEALIERPELLLHPDKYSNEILPRVFPLPVLTFPNAANGTKLEKMGLRGLQGLQMNEEELGAKIGYWAALPKLEDLSGRICFQNAEDWGKAKMFLVPFAKALLKGRNHRTEVGPEFHSMEAGLTSMGIKYQYEPEFEYPLDLVFPAEPFYELKSVNSGVCDICHTKLIKPQGHLISPWIFRRNLNAQDFVIDLMGNNDQAKVKFDLDWSPWLFCNTCLNKFQEANWIPKR